MYAESARLGALGSFFALPRGAFSGLSAALRDYNEVSTCINNDRSGKVKDWGKEELNGGVGIIVYRRHPATRTVNNTLPSKGLLKELRIHRDKKRGWASYIGARMSHTTTRTPTPTVSKTIPMTETSQDACEMHIRAPR